MTVVTTSSTADGGSFGLIRAIASRRRPGMISSSHDSRSPEPLAICLPLTGNHPSSARCSMAKMLPLRLRHPARHHVTSSTTFSASRTRISPDISFGSSVSRNCGESLILTLTLLSELIKITQDIFQLLRLLSR